MSSLRFFAAAALAGLIALSTATAEPLPPSLPNVPRDLSRQPRIRDLSTLAGLRCARLASLSLPTGRVDFASVVEAVPSGAVYSPASGVSLSDLPRFCRIKGTASPTRTSLINFEVWIPFDGSYRNRYLQVGNGGFSGVIVYGALADGVRRGFATASTDDGNQDPLSAAFAANPQRLIDYGHRALKQTTDNAKAIIAAFAGVGPERSYFHGCSNGGREALMEAQRYGNDFDGVLAGAPANFFTHQFASFAWNAQQVYPAPPAGAVSRLPIAKLQVLTNYMRAQCVGTDGGHSSDRFLTNPPACSASLAPITCTGADAPTCLTADEAGIVRHLYDGPSYAGTSTKIFPGLARGSESYGANWPFWITGPGAAPPESTQFSFAKGFFQHFPHGLSTHDARTVPVPTAMGAIDGALALHLNATNPDLRVFHDHGGKLIVYHGFDDAAVAPGNSIDYWASVHATMSGLRPGSPVDGYYRLFMVPGFSHCALGRGINALFGDTVHHVGVDADHDFLVALEKWVEDGRVPTRLIGTHFDLDAADTAPDPIFQRPVCPYPQLPRYLGGNHLLAASWGCQVPPRLKLRPDIRPKVLPKKLPIPPRPSPEFRTQ